MSSNNALTVANFQPESSIKDNDSYDDDKKSRKDEIDKFNQQVLDLFETEPGAGLDANKVFALVYPKLQELARLHTPISFQELTNAIVYADTQMQTQPEHADYEQNTLRKTACFVVEYDSYYTDIMNKFLWPDDDDESVTLEKW